MRQGNPELETSPETGAVRQLVASARPPFVSLYLPLDGSPDAVQNAVRARQAVESASKRIEELGVPAEVGRRMSELLSAVERAVGAPTPLQGTLVALVDAERVRLAPLATRLPLRVAVGRSFLLRPLVRARACESRFRILAVSERRVALFEGDPRGVVPVAAEGLPASLEDATGDGGRDVERFHRVLGRALARRFCGDRMPLVLAADAAHQSGLRALLRLPGLLEEGVVASPDALPPAELHARAWPLVEAALKARQREVFERWERARNRRRTVERVDEVARAVTSGRIRTLWADEDATLPGRVDPVSGAILPPVGDDDVMEHLAMLALAKGGEVHVLAAGDLPSPGGVAAELL